MGQRLHTALGLLVLVVLSSCATTIVSAARYGGFEGQGERRLRLHMDRVKLEPGPVIPQVCFECGIPGDGTNQAFVRIPFFATNESQAPWLLTGNMFRLERNGEEWDALNRNPKVDHSSVIANVAPRSSAQFSVLLSFVGSEGIGEDSDLITTYRLSVIDQDGELLLERVISIGYFNQLEQFGRFLGTFTVALLALGAI